MSVTIRKLQASAPAFRQQLKAALAWEALSDAGVNSRVQEIIDDVRARGDAAVLHWTNTFDRLGASDISALKIAPERLQQALAALPHDQATALRTAADRIRAYHERQRQPSWQYTDADGSVYGQQITPIDRVGMYVPGGLGSSPRRPGETCRVARRPIPRPC